MRARRSGARGGRRAHPVLRAARRVAVGVAGAVVLVVGLVLVPAPGPGWLVVLAGLALLATEFEWARRLERRLLVKMRGWAALAARRSPAQRAAGVVGAGVFAALGVLAVLWFAGVPAWVPDVIEHPLTDAVGLLPAR